MTGRGVQEIAAGIWYWQRRPRGLRPGEFGTRTSYALTVGSQTLLIDPLIDGDNDPALAALDTLAAWPRADPHYQAVSHPQRRAAVAPLPPCAGAHLRASGSGHPAR